jgi:hypothetical protein
MRNQAAGRCELSVPPRDGGDVAHHRGAGDIGSYFVPVTDA